MFNRIHNYNLGVFIIRFALALIFIVHGAMKAISIPGTIGFFGTLGLSVPVAYFVTAVELIAGVFLLLGLMTSLCGLVLAIDMAVAIMLTHTVRPFVGGFEFEVVLLLCSLALVFLPTGTFSFEKVFNRANIEYKVHD